MNLRCPFCRSHATTWTSADTKKGGKGAALRCEACERKVDAPKYDPAPNYECEEWDFHEQAWTSPRHAAWSNYLPTGRFVRIFGDGEHVLGAAGEALAQVVEARNRPLEIDEVRRVFAGAVGTNPGPIDIEILGALALFLWGAKPRFSKSWYRRDPKRPRFNRLGDVLRFSAGPLGVGSGGWVSRQDGPRLELAETRRPPAPRSRVSAKKLALIRLVAPDVADELQREHDSRRVGGMRSGLVHATTSSHNGSTGGARNLVGIELGHDITRALTAKRKDGGRVVSADDISLLRIVHADAKPDRRAAIEHVLLEEGLLTAGMTKAERDPVVAEHKHRISNRLNRATKAISRLLRALPKDGFDESGAPREPDFGMVPLLRPADEDEDHDLPEAEEAKPGLAKCAPLEATPSIWSAG